MADIEGFIARWTANEGGQERANYALFLSELADVLGVPRPEPAAGNSELNDYVFERAVKEPNGDGTFSHRRIDLYKRGCFVLEAKQSRLKPGSAKEMVPAPRRCGAEASRRMLRPPQFARAPSRVRGRRYPPQTPPASYARRTESNRGVS